MVVTEMLSLMLAAGQVAVLVGQLLGLLVCLCLGLSVCLVIAMWRG